MQWIGITGGIAMGKSRVCEILSEHGAPVLFADKIVHELLGARGPAVAAVAQVFGRDLVTPDQSIDRKKLGRIVFGDSKKLATLENILHPLVQSQVLVLRKNLAAQGFGAAFYEIPLLFEKNLQKNFDEIIVVTSDLGLQRARLKSRDKLSENEISSRLAAQKPIAEKISGADVVIENNGNEADLRKQVEEKILRRYTITKPS